MEIEQRPERIPAGPPPLDCEEEPCGCECTCEDLKAHAHHPACEDHEHGGHRCHSGEGERLPRAHHGEAPQPQQHQQHAGDALHSSPEPCKAHQYHPQHTRCQQACEEGDAEVHPAHPAPRTRVELGGERLDCGAGGACGGSARACEHAWEQEGERDTDENAQESEDHAPTIVAQGPSANPSPALAAHSLRPGTFSLVDTLPGMHAPTGLNLALRYRPRTFAELTGQRHVAAVLGRAVLAGSVSPQLLFSGGSGLGKTTVARICAAALLCETPLSQRPAGDACGVCETCLDVTTPGRSHPDVIELDAASHGRVDEIRAIAESAQFVPVRASRKIYIVDEAHGLSGPGGQAFLKLLEEPPPHVVFMLATTDPEKMLATNRGRCTQFELLRPSDEELVANLMRVTSGEGWELSDEAARAVVAVTDPVLGVRGTLMTLEKLAPALRRGEAVDDEVLAALLGVAPSTLTSALTSAIEAGERPALTLALEELRSQVSEEAIRTALLAWARARFRAAAASGAAEAELRAYELVADAAPGPVATEILLAKLADPRLDPDPAAAATIVQGAEAKVTELLRIARAARELTDATSAELSAASAERAELQAELVTERARLDELRGELSTELQALRDARAELEAVRTAAAEAHALLTDDLERARRAVSALREAGTASSAKPTPTSPPARSTTRSAAAKPSATASPAPPAKPAPATAASAASRSAADHEAAAKRFTDAVALSSERVAKMLAACELTPGPRLQITAPARAREVMTREDVAAVLRAASVAVSVEYDLTFT